MRNDNWLKLIDALGHFNIGKNFWFSLKTHDDDGNKIPNKDRMQYKYLKLNDDTATMPSEDDVNAKIQELKDAETAHTNARTTGKAKLKSGDALTDAEIKALFGE